VEIIEAIYWKKCNVLDILNNLNITFVNNGSLSQSNIACFLSHRLAWQKILDNKDNLSIILEDDMDLLNFQLFLDTQKQILDLDYYDGIIMWRHPENFPQNLKHISDNLIEYYFQWGLCAYHIKPNLCQEMLNINNIDAPIDDYVYRNIFPNYKMYFTDKDLFFNQGFIKFKSNISNYIPPNYIHISNDL